MTQTATQIGEQTALEKFNDTVELHGQMLLLITKAPKFKYEQLINDVRAICQAEPHYFVGWQMSNFKLFIHQFLKSDDTMESVIHGINADLKIELKLCVEKNVPDDPKILCTHCSTLKPSSQYGSDGKGGKTEMCHKCKGIVAQNTAKVKKQIREAKGEPETRKCNRCYQYKSLLEYPTNIQGGHRRTCMKCLGWPDHQITAYTNPETPITTAVIPDEVIDKSVKETAPPDKKWSVVIVYRKDGDDRPSIHNEIVTTTNKDTALQYGFATLSKIDIPFCVVSKMVTEIEESKPETNE